MKGNTGSAVVTQNRFGRDPLMGQIVMIVMGKFKRHRGRVTHADDKTVQVELNTLCKKLPIDKINVELVKSDKEKQRDQAGRSVYGNASVYGGATVYDGVKTPMANKNTPSYYPQSAWGGGQEYDDRGNDFMARAGSEHVSNYQFAKSNDLNEYIKRESKGWGDN